MSAIRISPGDRYYDLLSDEAVTVLNVSPQLNRLVIETEGCVEEVQQLSAFLKRLRHGDIALVEEARLLKGGDEEH